MICTTNAPFIKRLLQLNKMFKRCSAIARVIILLYNALFCDCAYNEINRPACKRGGSVSVFVFVLFLLLFRLFLFRRVEFSCRFYKRGIAEYQCAYGNYDSDIRKHESIVSHTVYPYVFERGIFGKSEHARKDMAQKAQRACGDRAQSELNLR